MRYPARDWATFRRWPAWLFVSAVIAMASCSDEGPTTPTTTVTRLQLPPTADFPAGTVLQIVSGENQRPVGGARFRVGSKVLTADDSGSIALPEDFDAGTFVDIEDPGFLVRQTLLRKDGGGRFSLWPKTSASGLTEDFTSEVVYHPSTGTSRRMMRIPPDTMVFVVPSSQIRNDPRALEATSAAVAQLNEIAGGEVQFAVDADPPAMFVRFDLLIDPGDEAMTGNVVAVARRRFSGWSIVGGTIVYNSIEIARTSAAHHELGHLFGLAHSASRADVMYPTLRRRVETFSPRERLAMRLMLQRPASNIHPDNDRHLRTDESLAADRVSVVVCY
jgi:hypothetical protein